MNQNVEAEPIAKLVPMLTPKINNWQTLLLPISAFPLVQEELEPIRRFLVEVAKLLTRESVMKHHVLFQTWNLSPATGSEVVSANRRKWSPRLGRGIWPNRKQTDGWTEEMMVDAAAAVIKGDEPRLPLDKLLLVVESNKEALQASSLMTGFGIQIQVFSKLDFDAISAKATGNFKDLLAQHNAPEAAFLCPLLDQEGIGAALTDDRLESWLCGAEAYIRESPEDKGILLTLRTPLATAVLALHTRLSQSRDSHDQVS